MTSLATYSAIAALASSLATAVTKPMRRLLTRMPATAALVWLSTCAVGFAQVSPTPGMGATSPLGTGSSGFNTQSNGIPLGATELNPGGLSPSPCAGMTASGNGVAGALSTFDGGSVISNSSACTSSTAGNSAGIGGTPQAGATTGGPTAGNSTIPLGSTELGAAGESPVTTNPAPSIPNPSIPNPSTSGPNVGVMPAPSLPGPSSPPPSSPTTPCFGAMNTVTPLTSPSGC
jgi:hypothetical protein